MSDHADGKVFQSFGVATLKVGEAEDNFVPDLQSKYSLADRNDLVDLQSINSEFRC